MQALQVRVFRRHDGSPSKISVFLKRLHGSGKALPAQREGDVMPKCRVWVETIGMIDGDEVQHHRSYDDVFQTPGRIDSNLSPQVITGL